MGNLLGAPVTDKETHVGSTPEGLKYGMSTMQGWRVHMEDAHICQPHLYAEEIITTPSSSSSSDSSQNTSSSSSDTTPPPPPTTTKTTTTTTSASTKRYERIFLPGHSLFAVFDGHGGTFAAEYAGRNMCRVLSRQPLFVKYAKFIRDHPEVEQQQQQQQQQQTTMTTTTVGGSNSDNGDNEKNSGGNESNAGEKRRREKRDHDPMRQAQLNREGLDLLENALRDAFVELDREIMREVQGIGNEDANMYYGEEEDGHKRSSNISLTTAQPTSEEKNEEDMDVTHPTDTSSSSPSNPIPNEDEDSGTTAVVVILTPRWIVCANAGDSRAVYSKSGGRAVPLSYDHKPDDEEEERRIKEAGGYVSGKRVQGDLAVSRGLGDFRFKDVDTVMAGCLPSGTGRADATLSGAAPEKKNATGGVNTDDNGGDSDQNCQPSVAMLRPDDQKVSPVPDVIVQNRHPSDDEFVIVACDGIWDVQTNHECVAAVRDIFEDGEADLGLVCEEVLDLCLRKGSKDNMTSLVIQLEAQKVAEDGGGVRLRREIREAEEAKERDENRLQGDSEYFANPNSPDYS